MWVLRVIGDGFRGVFFVVCSCGGVVSVCLLLSWWMCGWGGVWVVGLVCVFFVWCVRWLVCGCVVAAVCVLVGGVGVFLGWFWWWMVCGVCC